MEHHNLLVFLGHDRAPWRKVVPLADFAHICRKPLGPARKKPGEKPGGGVRHASSESEDDSFRVLE